MTASGAARSSTAGCPSTSPAGVDQSSASRRGQPTFGDELADAHAFRARPRWRGCVDSRRGTRRCGWQAWVPAGRQGQVGAAMRRRGSARVAAVHRAADPRVHPRLDRGLAAHRISPRTTRCIRVAPWPLGRIRSRRGRGASHHAVVRGASASRRGRAARPHRVEGLVRGLPPSWPARVGVASGPRDGPSARRARRLAAGGVAAGGRPPRLALPPGCSPPPRTGAAARSRDGAPGSRPSLGRSFMGAKAVDWTMARLAPCGATPPGSGPGGG